MTKDYIFIDIDGVLNHWRPYHPGLPGTDPEDWQKHFIIGVTVHLSPIVLQALNDLIVNNDLIPVWSTTWINHPEHLDRFSEIIEPHLPGSAGWDRIDHIEAMWGASGKLPGIMDYLATVDADSVVVLDDMFEQHEINTISEVVPNSMYVAPHFFLTLDDLTNVQETMYD